MLNLYLNLDLSGTAVILKSIRCNTSVPILTFESLVVFYGVYDFYKDKTMFTCVLTRTGRGVSSRVLVSRGASWCRGVAACRCTGARTPSGSRCLTQGDTIERHVQYGENNR